MTDKQIEGLFIAVMGLAVIVCAIGVVIADIREERSRQKRYRNHWD